MQPPEGIRGAFDREAPFWHQRHAGGLIARLILRWRTRRLMRLCCLHRAARVLDVGCGSGAQLAALRPHIAAAVGIDISPLMIAEARKLWTAAKDPQLHFQIAAIEEVTADALGRFDAILFIGSLEHMRAPGLALARAAALLHPGGRVAVIMPHPYHPRALWHRLQARVGRIPPFRHLTARALRQMAIAAGLRPVPIDLPSRLENAVALGLLGSLLVVFERPAAATPAAPTTTP